LQDESIDNSGVVVEKEGLQTNPLAEHFNITVSIPESVEIKMVNASILSEYEIWVLLTTIISSAASGFWVAYITNTTTEITEILKWNSLLITLLFLIFLGVALKKRSNLNLKTKKITLKTSQTN
jgi:hypothetical protein